MDLQALLNYPGALPAMSRTVTDLMTEMNKEDPDPRRVGTLIAQDPSLTTRVLRLSNSSFFRASRKIGDPHDAVAMLGMTHVRSLVMAAALGSSFKNVPGVNLQQFWRYSLKVADHARTFAGLVRQSESNAYTAGLIHAIGDLVMHIAMPDDIGPLDMGTPPLDLQRAAAERNRFGYTFAEVGAGMVERWNFPVAIVNALKFQNEPFEGDTYEPLAGVVHLASWRARAEEIQLDDSGLAATFPDMVGISLGLDLGNVLGKEPDEWALTDAMAAFLD